MPETMNAAGVIPEGVLAGLLLQAARKGKVGRLLPAFKSLKSARKGAMVYSPEVPSEKQLQFLGLDCLEALYGGAAGGGKSSALLHAALQYVHVPGYSALLLRRTYADLTLPGALLDRAHEWWRSTDAKWNDQKKTWTFPSGATITFGYLEHENDKYRYQGAELQFVGFDELTQFSESQYRYLFSRLRRSSSANVPIRMRSASNPGGSGHEWVRRWFGLGETDEKPEGRVFVSAKLEDNPGVDLVAYDESLAQLDPLTRQQLRDGDWAASTTGGLFQRQWFPVVDDAPAECQWVRYWDLAATAAAPGKDPDYTVGAKVGIHHGVFYVADIRRERLTPQGVEDLVKQTAQIDGRGVRIVMEQEPGSSGVNTIDHYRRYVLAGFAFSGSKTTGGKILRARPVSSAAEAGNVKFQRAAWNTAALDEFSAFPLGSHDDQVDAVSGAVEQLTIMVKPNQSATGGRLRGF